MLTTEVQNEVTPATRQRPEVVTTTSWEAMMPKTTTSFEERFWAKVDKTPGHGPDGFCWLWTAACSSDGYGNVRRQGPAVGAHRAAYELLVGPIPDGLELDHLCRVRTCVNAAHLEPVTHAENMRRGMAGVPQSSRTHCPAGHAYDEVNSYVQYRGTGKQQRRCHACDRASTARRRRLAREAAERLVAQGSKMNDELQPDAESESAVETEGGSGSLPSVASGESPARH